MSTTAWWALGFALGGVVTLLAAALLVTIIILARRIVGQAAAITYALDQARINTSALLDVADVNHTLESIARGVEKARGESKGVEDERGLLSRVAHRLTGGGR